MSKSSIKVIAVLIPALLVAYYLVFIPLRDRRAASDFMIAYHKYELANTAFIVPLFAYGDDANYRIFDDDQLKMELASDFTPAGRTIGRAYRIQLAEGAIEDNNGIIKFINETTDKPQGDCEEAMLALNTAAGSLKNPEIRKCATEICDLILKRHNYLISHKQTLLEKHKLFSEMMKSIIEDNGKSGKLSSFLVQNTGRIKKLTEIIERSNADYGEQAIDTLYARFEGLVKR